MALGPLPGVQEPVTTSRWRAWFQSVHTALGAVETTVAAILGTANTWTAAQTFSVAPILSAGANLTGGQIVFPATQSASANANTLDDYEEGTWTPVIAFGGASVGVTYSTQAGIYTKIGHRVIASIRITLTSRGSSVGAATITALPFTPSAAVACGWWADNYTVGAGLIPVFDTSGTSIRLRSFNPTTGNEGAVAETQVDNDFNIKLSLSFTV